MKSRDANRAILEQAMINEENNVSSIIVPIPLNIVVSDSYSRTISANNGYKLIKEKSVVHSYAIVSIHVINKMPFLNKYENAIIAYIASVIKFNSNIVYIKPESICAILHTDKVYTRDFYPAIRHLTNLNIIYIRPNIKVIMLLILLLFLKAVLLNLLKIIILIFKVITPLLLMIK